ncbi:MAG: hypothetical protein QOH61_1882 [Chloroflexota bacterium]|nr:hypothetical protein [Chloroflexota bacterium]
MLDRLSTNPGLLRLPLVRSGTELAVGVDETAWKRMVATATA